MKRLHRAPFTLAVLSGLLAPGVLFTALLSPAVRGAGEDEPELVVIRARRVITVSGQTYRPGMVVIEDGKVRAVGQRLEYPRTATVIDAPGETVMPGLILPGSRFGLSRYSRSGLHGKESAADEVFLSELEFDALLAAGYTLVAYVPEGTGIPGVASLVRTGGRDGPRLIQERSYLRVTMSSPGRDKPALRSALDAAKKEIEKVAKAREEWEKKQKEAQEKAAKEKEPEKKEPEKDGPDRKPPEKTPEPAEKGKDAPAKPAGFEPPKINPDLQPLVDLIEDKPGAAVVFELSQASDLHHLDSVLADYPQIEARYRLATRSSSDYHHVVPALGERKALLMMEPVLGTIPHTVNDTNIAAELARAGCRIAFVPRDDSESELRALRARLADLVRSGLKRETALAAVTLNAARILGADDRYGSLEKGKEADIIFLNGDPLGPERRVTRVMIGGEVIWEAASR